MENIIELKSLRKEYDEFTLNDISFKLPYGFIMGLIGPNGAGKTTIIKLIMNLIKKDSGEIYIFGKDHIINEMEVKSRIGFVYDTSNFYEHLTLKQMKSLIAPFYKAWDEAMFKKYIAEFDLPLNKKINTLSRGMKMKYALTMALSHHADLIVMDEPTSGLDPVFRKQLLGILSGVIQDERKSILFSTHITSDLEKTADYITFINKGELIFSHSKDEIFENYGLVKGGKEILNQKSREFFTGIHVHNYGFEALTSDIQEARRKFKSNAVVEKATLEDIMVFTSKKEGGQDV